MQTRIEPSKLSSLAVRKVEPFELPTVLPWVNIYIDSAVDGCSVPDRNTVINRLMRGTAHLFMASEEGAILGICVVRLGAVEGGQVCDIWFCAGKNVAGWIDGLVEVETWAKGQGVIRMRSEIRRGFEMPMKDLGYTVTHMTVQKEI